MEEPLIQVKNLKKYFIFTIKYCGKTKKGENMILINYCVLMKWRFYYEKMFEMWNKNERKLHN